ncbi:unnamed protein product [Caenorhabditis sp. 36 PRJEB53466]|nr:unnamed protein product [Caenorhabditis sp. 36 PRJEB53466]
MKMKRKKSSSDRKVNKRHKHLREKRRAIYKPRNVEKIVRNDPRYPVVLPPASNPNLKFRKFNLDDNSRFMKGRAVPPRHLKGKSVHPRPHFRYRGVKKMIV